MRKNLLNAFDKKSREKLITYYAWYTYYIMVLYAGDDSMSIIFYIKFKQIIFKFLKTNVLITNFNSLAMKFYLLILDRIKNNLYSLINSL